MIILQEKGVPNNSHLLIHLVINFVRWGVALLLIVMYYDNIMIILCMCRLL